MGNLAKMGYPDVRSATPKMKVYAGRFETDGTNNPPAASIKGEGFTVAKGGTTGQWVVTLDAAVGEFLHIGHSLWGATSGTDSSNRIILTPDPGDIRTKATLTIEAHSADGTEANLDGPIISFIAVVSMNPS